MQEKLFFEELRSGIEQMIREELQQSISPLPQWLRSSQVKEMLNISDSTLQTLRINGTIPSYRLGSSWFYKYDEIISVLEANRVGRKEKDNE